MTGTRFAAAGLAIVVCVMGLFLFLYSDIRILPKMNMNSIVIEFSHNNIPQDQVLNDLLIPIEKKILELKSVISVETGMGHQKSVVVVEKKFGHGASLQDQLADIFAGAGVSCTIEPFTDASYPVFHYMLYSVEYPNGVEDAAARFKGSLEETAGVGKVVLNQGFEDLRDIEAFKRFNGHNAVSLSVFIKKDHNMKQVIQECERLKKEYEKKYYLEIAPVDNEFEMMETLVRKAAVFLLISAFTAGGLGWFFLGDRAIFASLSMIFCCELSILMLHLTGISLNLMSVIGMLLFAGYSLAIAFITMEYTKTEAGNNVRQAVLSIVLSALGYVVLLLSGLLLKGILEDFSRDLFLGAVFMILVSVAIFFLTAARYPLSGGGENRRFLSGPEKFWHLLIDNKPVAIVVIFMAVIITVMPMVKWTAIGRFLMLPESDEYRLYVRITGENDSETAKALTRVEQQLGDMAEVEYVIADYGVIYPFNGLADRMSGENVAQIVALLRPGADHDKIKKSLASGQDGNRAHLDIQVKNSSDSDAYPFKSYIYCDNYDSLKRFSEEYRTALGLITGVSNVQSSMDGDYIERKNARFYSVIGADMDESVLMKEDIITGMETHAFSVAPCDVQYEDLSEEVQQQMASGMLKMFSISSFGLFIVLIIIMITHRSFLGLLIPFSTLFIFAGIVNLKGHICLTHIISIFGIQSIWTVKLLIFLRDFNLNENPDVSERIVACMRRSFSSALVIYPPLVAGYVYLWISGDSFVKSISVSFVGGLMYLLYLDLVFLPVAKKIECRMFGRG